MGSSDALNAVIKSESRPVPSESQRCVIRRSEGNQEERRPTKREIRGLKGEIRMVAVKPRGNASTGSGLVSHEVPRWRQTCECIIIMSEYPRVGAGGVGATQQSHAPCTVDMTLCWGALNCKCLSSSLPDAWEHCPGLIRARERRIMYLDYSCPPRS
jgi:hypothetical protein